MPNKPRPYQQTVIMCKVCPEQGSMSEMVAHAVDTGHGFTPRTPPVEPRTTPVIPE